MENAKEKFQRLSKILDTDDFMRLRQAGIFAGGTEEKFPVFAREPYDIITVDGCYHIPAQLLDTLNQRVRDLQLCYSCLRSVFSAEDPKSAFNKFSRDYMSALPPGSGLFPPYAMFTLEDFLAWQYRLTAVHSTVATRTQLDKQAIHKIQLEHLTQISDEECLALKNQMKERFGHLSPDSDRLSQYLKIVDDLVDLVRQPIEDLQDAAVKNET
jgi:hypothetical protein